MAQQAAKPKPRYMKMINRYFENGFNQREAAEHAGFKNPMNNSPRLFARADVKGEVERRQKVAREKHEITKEWLVEKWKKIASARVYDLLVINGDGSATLDLNLMTPELEEALGEFTVETYVEGRGDDAETVKRVKFKPLDRLRAMEGLARVGGHFSETVKHEMGDDLIARINAGRRRAGQVDGAATVEALTDATIEGETDGG